MRKSLLCFSVMCAGLPATVFAAVPANVTTALTDMQADALTVAGIFLVAVIAVIAFKFMRKGAS